ncbi:MAG: formyl transferase [Candidatus Koribacter versatilis]|uniref:phosphoribosylglycinamide formyltransferase 1 n=1 Tax=Candidatus Korobacter versatilis TaxID=658062 RepID=A0A932A7Q4_9BACT|nr:formyl transferase [Candidatus Koribacter versatilis]
MTDAQPNAAATPKQKTLVLLTRPGDYGRIVHNFLAQRFPFNAVVYEAPGSSWELARRRVERLGLWHTLGQIAFRAGVFPLLALGARARIAELMREHGLATAPVPKEVETIHVPSVNSSACLAALERLKPDVVIVAGTRILSEQALAAVPGAAFVNIHAGITPLYRGVHGAYWALAENDAAHCGVTVHLVDKGIDTGGILAQAQVVPTHRDNFATYGLLQTAAGLALLRDEVLARLLAGDRSTRRAPAGASRLWSHPTAWQYLRTRLARGVR